MNSAVTVTQKQLSDFLLNVAHERHVFIWGPPGTGKSALVQQFAEELGLPCVSLLGSQLAPEDLIGVPQILDGVSRFCPPRMIAPDFPKDSPILVITDGYCDKLTIRRDHAFIVPEGRHLPFVPRGEVFRIR